MQAFTQIKGVAAPIHEPNVDTNQICPTRFNKVSRGPEYARVLFHDRRFNLDGSEKEHLLNIDPYNRAQIIVADRNWGCGSSRESAVYALYEFGIRCVIATSFGDIHANNCAKNGLLPVILSEAEVLELHQQLALKPGAEIAVDLATQSVTAPNGRVFQFDIHPVRKLCLLKGLDDIARTEQYAEAAQAFHAHYDRERPWLNPLSAH